MTSVGKLRECGICRDMGLQPPKFDTRSEYRGHLQAHWNNSEGRRAEEWRSKRSGSGRSDDQGGYLSHKKAR